MKNRVKNFIIIVITLIVFAMILLFVSFQIRQNVAIFRAVVVEVYDKGMLVMGLKDPYGGLISLGFTDEGNIGFKQGQEIAINCDGVLIQTGPAQLGEVRDIKIIKEKSKTEIPENVLRYAFSTYENVDITISDFTNKGMSVTITDKNEYPYPIFENYIIRKKVKNEKYDSTDVGTYIESTENSTSSYIPPEQEYIWKELEKISDITKKDTFEKLIYNMPNMTGDEDYKISGRKINWEPLYGALSQGEYNIILNGYNSIIINLDFTIDENGNVTYSEPEIIP